MTYDHRVELTENDHEVFRRQGLLHLQRRIPRKACEAASAAIIDELERLKLRVSGKPASSRIQHLPVFQQTGHLSQKIDIGPKLDALFPAELLAVMGSLAGARLKATPPQLLLSFPHKEDWSLNRLNWHLDLAVPKRDEIPGVQAFVLIGDLQPHGGATLALAGTHRLPYLPGNTSGSAVPVLRRHQVFKGLFESDGASPEALFRPQNIDGAEIRVVEMSGRAGDVYLMDLRVLHTPSINATTNIRMMATMRAPK